METQTHAEAPASGFRPEYIHRPANTRQQDLFLLAKGHYDVKDHPRAEAARLVVGIHNLHEPATMSWQSAAICTVNDLVGGVLQLEGSALNRFLIEMGPSVLDGMLGTGNKFEQPGGYYHVLLDHVLSEVCRVQVIKGDRWLMHFPRPDVDPTILKFLQAYKAN